MNRITNENFKEMYPHVERALRNASFIAIDAEFSGLISGTGEEPSGQSLFDTAAERYGKLRKQIDPFIAIQFGLTAFGHKNGENKYSAESFVFYLIPRDLPTRNRVFLFQSAAIDFLSSYSFDFNQFACNSISYLDEEDERNLRRSLKDNVSLWLARDFISMKVEEEIDDCFKRVQNWLADASCTDKVLTMETSSFPVEYLLHKELRHSFKNVWTESSGKRMLSVIKVTADVRTSLEEENNVADKLDTELLDYYMGFSKVFKLMTSLKKPIVGHNLLLDLMFMHKQFFTPLPRRYETFKGNINRLFPLVYDTKYLSFELKKVLHRETWKSNVLGNLYGYFKDGAGRYLVLNSPRIEPPGNNAVIDQERFHDAGWDSYCTGYCFIRMAHIYAVKKLSNEADMRDLTNAEIMTGVRDRVNRVNLIRADLSHLRLDNPDPPSTRPRWLHVRTTTNDITTRQKSIRTVQIPRVLEIAQAFSCFGVVDVKRYSAKCLLVAVSNHGIARNILKRYEKGLEFRVVPYNPLIHSPKTKVLLWTGSLILTGAGFFAWFLGRNTLESKPLG